VLDDGVRGVAHGVSGLTIGVAGVVGESDTATGVAAASGTGTGCSVQSDTGIGVSATANNATSVNPAIKAQSNGKGEALRAANSAAATAPAVQATSVATVPAVRATGKTVGVSGSVPVAGNGAALTVQGVAAFTRSGVMTVPPAAASVVVNVPGGLSAASHVLATCQTHVASGAQPQIQAAVPNAATGKITIYLAAAAPAGGVAVAWFVFG
jgi:hypothetical protein